MEREYKPNYINNDTSDEEVMVSSDSNENIFDFDEVLDFDELEAKWIPNCMCLCGLHSGGGSGGN